EDLLGGGGNIATRLEGIAEPGGICISEDAFRQVRGKIEGKFADLGEQNLKNIASLLRVYRVAVGPRAGACPWQGTGGPHAGETPAVQTTSVLPLPDKPSIAVLPFANLSGDPEQEYFVDGVVEEIITAISRLPWLFVIAPNSSFAYKRRSPDLRQVGRELGVRYVLEGSLRKAGNRVRITCQLIDTTTGAYIWADRFDRALDDIFELQDEVASRVAGAIEPRLRLAEIERGRSKPTESLDAYDLYLRGVAAFRRATQEGFEEGFRFAQRALEIDPGFAPAAGLAAICRVNQTSEGWVRNTPEIAAEALRLARQAIETGRDDPDALLMAAHAIGQFAGDTTTAGVTIDRALVLNPNSADAWNVRGWLYLYVDQAEAAIEALERAVRLSPLDKGLYGLSLGLARAHLTAGRYDAATAWIDKTVAQYPSYGTALRLKVVLCELMERHAEAREWLARLREVAPDMTIESFAAYAARHYTPRLRTLFIDALRKAGLPEE
ncbi:MAG: tetratricopeptide repeat protein, partial [Acetobacteraceae bacterium]|nr:tetratricopeptide repeat protein [Acetobacteraceae bacterium]